MTTRMRLIGIPLALALLGIACATAVSAQSLGGLLNRVKQAKGKSTPASDQKAPQADDVNGQPNLTAMKIDFIPGEKTIFYDDFSDMAADEPPPHWKVRGDAVELREGGGIRELTPLGRSDMNSPALVIPKNFTLEVDVRNPEHLSITLGKGEVDGVGRGAVLDTLLTQSPGGARDTVQVVVHDPTSELGNPTVGGVDLSKPVQFGLWVQSGRLRVYVNGNRVLDVNQVDLPAVDRLYLGPWTDKDHPIGIRRVRVAESAPDFSTTIASGKYVSHGITFDTDSDRLKPESAGVLRMVANALDKNPNLKLAINGYTDSVGEAAHNLDLSKRRAAAVRSVLISQFGVDASRLTADGFGAAQPIGSNDTAEGRAANRRVEFVKQ
jgi:OmpA-OmpF porin, OOP family